MCLFGMHKNFFDNTDVWNVTTTTVIMTMTYNIQHDHIHCIYRSHMYDLREGKWILKTAITHSQRQIKDSGNLNL